GGITVSGIIWLPCASSTSSGTPASRHSWAIVSIGLRAPAYVGETTTSPANSLPQRSSSRPMQVAETGPHTPQLSSQTGSDPIGKKPLTTRPLRIDTSAVRRTNTVEPLDDKAIIEAARAAEAPLTEMIDCDAPQTAAARLSSSASMPSGSERSSRPGSSVRSLPYTLSCRGSRSWNCVCIPADDQPRSDLPLCPGVWNEARSKAT